MWPLKEQYWIWKSSAPTRKLVIQWIRELRTAQVNVNLFFSFSITVKLWLSILPYPLWVSMKRKLYCFQSKILSPFLPSLHMQYGTTWWYRVPQHCFQYSLLLFNAVLSEHWIFFLCCCNKPNLSLTPVYLQGLFNK